MTRGQQVLAINVLNQVEVGVSYALGYNIDSKQQGVCARVKTDNKGWTNWIDLDDGTLLAHLEQRKSRLEEQLEMVASCLTECSGGM